jgi:hypothetical protein
VVRRATDEMLAVTTPDPSLDALTRLNEGLAAYIDYVESNLEPFTSLVRGAASGDRFLREIYQDARSAITSRIFDSVGELGLSDSPATRLLVNGWSAMVEEAVITWVQERQVPKEELLRLLAAALPAVLQATADPG